MRSRKNIHRITIFPRLFLAAVLLVPVSAFLVPVSVSAAACPASGCASRNECITDSRIPEGSSCFATCDPSLGAATGCVGSLRCVSLTGHDVCVPESSPLIAGTTSEIPRCDEGRTCPTDRQYECTEGRCLIPNGEPCEVSNQCTSARCSENTSGQKLCVSQSSAGEVVSDPERPFVSITPRLGVDIPGVSLSPATNEGDYVQVSFLAQYINGAYRYLVAVVLIVAIVMVVYGGFRYLVGSSLGDIQAGKKIIVDAIFGMLFVLGAYMILNTINPSTLNLKVLQLSNVTPQELILRTTTAETGDEQAGGGGVSSSRPADPQFASCPILFDNPPEDPPDGTDIVRVREFSEKVQTLLSGSRTESVITAAEAAAECGLHMGACGHTAETIFGIAGATDNNNHGVRVTGVGRDNIHYLQELTRRCRQSSSEERPGCKTQARIDAAQRFGETVEGWPDSFTGLLQPGDFINIFTVWTDDDAPNGAGQHSAIFLGWEGNFARLFNGSWSGPARYTNYCIKSGCDRMYPISNIWRPE